jgi:hypothetical protein
MNNQLFTKQDFLKALKDASEKYPKLKIGSSYMSLLKYEKQGIILSPSQPIMVNGKFWRFYTKEEIDENVRRIIAHKSNP